MDFRCRLRQERERLGLNQKDFGAAGCVTKTTQFNYENGTSSPSAEYWALVASIGVDIQYVITGERTGDVSAALKLYADCWEAIEEALQTAKKTLPPEKKRQAADALYELAKQGESGVHELASGLAKVAA